MMVNELEILKTLLGSLVQNSGVAVGPGDDCAVLDFAGGKLLAAVDQLIGDVHYFSSGTSPRRAGAKLMKRNLSDIAAMGGIPRWALLSIAVAGRGDAPEWILEFCRGAADAGAKYDVAIVGGDIAALKNSGETASLSILGEVPCGERALLRSGAKAGECVYVTGCFGNSLGSEHHLDFEPRLREGRFLASNHWASAALDVSDGLLLDAARLATASGVTLRIDPGRVPRREGAAIAAALGDGEDYELLFTVAPERAPELEKAWPEEFAPLARIGEVMAGSGEVIAPDGSDLLKGRVIGYEH